MPTASDLVTDLPADFEVFGQAVDTSLADLKGGTTGQVLSKATGTDMDFTWVTPDDANAIQNSIVDAKGDLVAASANDTPARLAVGNNGETLVADSSTAVGLSYQSNWAAGKNKLINGDFRINQRSFTSTTTSGTFGFDRWLMSASNGTSTYSAQTFTPGAAPVAGYEGTNFARMDSTGQTLSSALTFLQQRMEDVRSFANQTVTVSFWAKAASGTPKVSIETDQQFGTGGSARVTTYGGQVTLSTSWARYSVSFAVPSVSGKTIGTGSYLGLYLWTSAGSDFNSRTNSLGIQTATIDFWGVQVEAGSVATAFQTASGSIAGELAMCQRYYIRLGTSLGGSDQRLARGVANSASQIQFTVTLPVQLRIQNSTSMDFSSLQAYDGNAVFAVSAIASSSTSNLNPAISATVSGATQKQFYELLTTSTSGYIAFTAELT
jgi:hypothetical protein